MAALRLNTPRGVYRLTLAAPAAVGAEQISLTLSCERADGLERVGFICEIARAGLDAVATNDPAALLARLAPWLEREFERTREAALKSLRSERTPLVVRFDREFPGPFSS
ncbi:MAG TPA: hypothetical protein VKT27_04670 [Candidatus Binataceae bacterium]|nr:hypothetical protein [Candidatus Binataceae bacterium]